MSAFIELSPRPVLQSSGLKLQLDISVRADIILSMKSRILFLCTYNSCRSQMAEGLVNHYLGDRFQAFSAGLEATRVNLLAFRVLAQIGIDITSQYSKTTAAFAGQQFDHVISLCSPTDANFPHSFGGVKIVHIIFDDPSLFSGTDKELIPLFQRLRDDMRQRLTEYLTEI